MFIARTFCGTRRGVSTLIIFAVVSIIYVLYSIGAQTDSRVSSMSIETDDSPFLIDTPGCRIPNMKAWSSAALHHMSSHVYHVRCGKPPLVESNDTHLQIVAEALPQYGITDPDLLTCCFRPLWRKIPSLPVHKTGHIDNKYLEDNVTYDKEIMYSSDCYTFLDSAEIRREFVRVECGVYDGTNIRPIYTDYHAFFPRLPEATMRNDTTSNGTNINILFIGMDSLSRLNMIRKMPRTYAFISQILKGIPMYGYSKIGLNTFPNLVALFTGLTPDGMVKACWPRRENHLDPCPWIWKEFSSQGYVTSYMEDSPKIHTFTYLKNGFIFQPTHFYSNTLFLAAEKDISANNLCLGPRNQIEVLLNCTYKHLKAMKRFRKKFFSFSWGVALAHDDINTAEVNDELYFNLLRNIEMEGMLNETFVVFVSDHGLRFGDFVETRQGQIENSLPALFLLIPGWFQKKYATAMDNVRLNQHRLLTPLDLHQTILDLLDPLTLETDEIIRRTKEKEQHLKDSISLFLPISENRSCEDAAIPAEFCACEYLSAIPLDDPVVNKAAKFIVSSINQKVRDYTSCFPHSLKKVHSAESGPPLYKVEHGAENIKEYRVTFYTNPSNALYQALVRHMTIDDSFRLVGEVSRLNAYGHQADCMPVYTLLPFCYCKTESHSV